MTFEEALKKSERYQKLADKKYYEYQQTGDPRYDRAQTKHEEMADAYRYAYKYLKDVNDDYTHRLNNYRYWVNEKRELPKREYTQEEVMELLRQAEQFLY